MRARLVVALSAICVGSCIVPIDDVEEDDGTAGTSGSAGASGGTTGGSAGSGGSWPGGSAGAGGSAGSAGSGGAAGSSGSGGSSAGAAGDAGSAGVGGSAGAGGTGGAPSCVIGFSDDFNDGAIATDWFTYSSNSGIVGEEIGGSLKLTMPSSVSGTTWHGFQTKNVYNLSSCATFVQVTDVFAVTFAYTAMSVKSGKNYVEIIQTANKIVTKRWVWSDSEQKYDTLIVKEGAYSAVDHAWWMIRESAGTIHFEVSKDGKLFAPFSSTTSPFDPSAVHVSLSVGSFQTGSNAGDSKFDNFNVAP